jgi:hypothetical protein
MITSKRTALPSLALLPGALLLPTSPHLVERAAVGADDKPCVDEEPEHGLDGKGPHRSHAHLEAGKSQRLTVRLVRLLLRPGTRGAKARVPFHHRHAHELLRHELFASYGS